MSSNNIRPDSFRLLQCICIKEDINKVITKGKIYYILYYDNIKDERNEINRYVDVFNDFNMKDHIGFLPIEYFEELKIFRDKQIDSILHNK